MTTPLVYYCMLYYLMTMIFNAASRAFSRLLTPQYRSMLWKSLGATLLVLLVLWFLVRQFFISYIFPWVSSFLPGMPDWASWFGLIGLIVFSLGLALLMALLIAPITAMIGGFFIDDAAEIIEREDYAQDPMGIAMPFGRSMIIAGKFLGLSILGNILALILYFVPGVNLIAFYVINGYLLGREYFQFAAMRLRTEEEASAFYKRNNLTVFMAGILVAIFVSIPILNLLTPLFAAAFMTYLHKELSKQR